MLKYFTCRKASKSHLNLCCCYYCYCCCYCCGGDFPVEEVDLGTILIAKPVYKPPPGWAQQEWLPLGSGCPYLGTVLMFMAHIFREGPADVCGLRFCLLVLVGCADAEGYVWDHGPTAPGVCVDAPVLPLKSLWTSVVLVASEAMLASVDCANTAYLSEWPMRPLEIMLASMYQTALEDLVWRPQSYFQLGAVFVV